MNSRKIVWIVTALTVVAVVAQAKDEETREGKMQQKEVAQYAPAGERGAQAPMRQASRLIGSEIRSSDNEKIGVIEDIVLSKGSDKVSYLVASTGGLVGIGEGRMAVPLNALRTDNGSQTLIVNLSQDEVKNVPKLGDDWPSETEQELQDAQKYFSRKTAEFKGWLSRDKESVDQVGQRDPQAGERVARTAEQQRWSRRVSNLIGLDARNDRNEVIGEISDLVLDTDKGTISFALIEIQDMEDMKNQTAICPWGSVNVLAGEKVAKVNASSATLRSVAFKSESMPDLSNRSYGQSVYERFNQKPYWTTYGYEGEGGYESKTNKPAKQKEMKKEPLRSGQGTTQREMKIEPLRSGQGTTQKERKNY